MHNKIYEKTKNFIKDISIILPFSFLLLAITLYPLPFYIYSGGGTIDVDDKIEIANSYKSKGSFNLCYVSEIKATIPTYLLAKILPSWDITPKEDVTLNNKETDTDVTKRDKIFLNDANVNAISVSYTKANKKIEITDTYNYIIYIDENSKTDLQVGDIITKLDNTNIGDLSDIRNIVSNHNVGDVLNIEYIRNNKKHSGTCEVIEKENVKQIGIGVQASYKYKTDPKIALKFSDNESGPSGGLLLALSIYNNLVEEDITNGLKIAGTGTIDLNGNVGSIGGVKYKLKGAVNSKADVFIVPNGENYNEAIKLQKSNNYKIKIIGVSTFDEALKKLQEMSK